MIRQFYPDRWFVSAAAVPYEQLYQDGIRGIIFDIDNTLVPHGAPADERTLSLFARLHALGFGTCLVSNNKKERVEPFARAVGSGYLYKAGKPGRSAYIRAMEQMGTDRKTTVFVGDQIFTDVYGAKRAGVTAFLVMPIDPKEEIQIVLKRALESVILWFYRRDGGRPEG